MVPLASDCGACSWWCCCCCCVKCKMLAVNKIGVARCTRRSSDDCFRLRQRPPTIAYLSPIRCRCRSRRRTVARRRPVCAVLPLPVQLLLPRVSKLRPKLLLSLLLFTFCLPTLALHQPKLQPQPHHQQLASTTEATTGAPPQSKSQPRTPLSTELRNNRTNRPQQVTFVESTSSSSTTTTTITTSTADCASSSGQTPSNASGKWQTMSVCG